MMKRRQRGRALSWLFGVLAAAILLMQPLLPPVTVSAQGINPRDLASRLKSFDAKNTVIRIRGDGAVPYQKVITVMDELKKSGLSRVQFDTQAGN